MDLATEPVTCYKCGADVKKSGFVVASVSYQAYTPEGSKLVKSSNRKSSFRTATCLLCSSGIAVPVDSLIEKKAA